MDYSMHQSVARELSPIMVNFTESNYVPEPYTAPREISDAHNQPRYGYTNNFEALINGDNDEAREYILGVLIGAMIILGVAILWFFVIVVLKVLGRKVGFFAGKLVRPNQSLNGDEGNEEKGGIEVVMDGDQPSNEDNENDLNEAVPVNVINNTVDDDHEKKFMRSVWAVRGIFVLSGIVVIISGGLFYGRGIVSFRNSVNEVRRGIEFFQKAALKTITLTDIVLQAESDIEDEIESTLSTQEIIQSTGQICGIDSDLSIVYDELTSSFDQLKNMVDGSLASFSHDLESVIDLTEEIENGLDSVDAVLYSLITISFIIIGLIFAMIVGVFFAWKGISNCFTKCMQYGILWPLFIFFLLLSWIFATLFLILSLVGADFCVSPDTHVQTLLDRDEDMFDGIIFGFILFYISGCALKPAGANDIIEIAAWGKVVLLQAHKLTILLEELPIESIASICGLTPQQATAFKTTIDFFHKGTHLMNDAIVGLRDILACETFNPIYTTFVHQAFCVQGVSGLNQIFTTTLVISIFSMIMIMFRAALYPIKEHAGPSASRNDDAMEVVQFNGNSSGEENANEAE